MAYTNYIHRTPSGAGDRQKFTISTWIKRPNPTGQGWIMTVDTYPSGNMFQYQLDTASNIGVQQYHGSSAQVAVTTNNLLRDPAAWYHLVLRVDTTQSTSADRVRIYINGTEASYNSTTYPSQNFNFEVNDTKKHSIGSREDTSSGTSLYYSHYHFCDGYSYGPDSFGSTDSTTGQWKINTSPSVSYGTNGFFVFKNGMNLSGSTVQDQSGQSNNLTLVGSSVETQDTPSDNFCTLNGILYAASQYTLSDGNNSIVYATDSSRSAFGTIGMTDNLGKFYWEVKIVSDSNNKGAYGICDDLYPDIQETGAFIDYSGGYGYFANGQSYNGGTGSSFGNSITTGDIVGVALDMDNLKLYFSKNGTWQNSGDPTSGSTGTGAAYTVAAGKTYFPAIRVRNGTNGAFNFGNGYFGTTAISSEGTNASGIGKFEYDVPSGYTALSTKGLNL